MEQVLGYSPSFACTLRRMGDGLLLKAMRLSYNPYISILDETSYPIRISNQSTWDFTYIARSYSPY